MGDGTLIRRYTCLKCKKQWILYEENKNIETKNNTKIKNAKRNIEIIILRENGKTMTDIGIQFGITKQRVSQILRGTK